MANKLMSKEYFSQKRYETTTEKATKYDIVVNKKNCIEFKENGIHCDPCFNNALVDRIEDLTSKDTADFLIHQVHLYENPIDFLRSLISFLNDNEDEFGSFSFSKVNLLIQQAELLINKLSESDEDEAKPKAINSEEYIDDVRIAELNQTTSQKFDLTRIIAFAEEMNTAFENRSYMSLIMLTRALIDHVAPIFGQENFAQVYAQYGSKSFKAQMKHLDISSRKIADSYLHTQIRKRESLPSKIQVNFSQDIDVLLSEIIRKLNE